MNLEKMEGDMDARTALPAEIGGKWDEHRLGGFIVQREIARGAGKNMLASGLGELDVEDAEEAVNVDLVASNMRIVMVDVGLNSVNSRAESVAKERSKLRRGRCGRCCELFDSDYVGRESVLDRGDRLIIECNRIFARNIVRPTLSGIGWKGPARGWVKAIWSSMQQDWLVRVRYVPRETNEVADKLAAMGRGQSMEGRVLFVPYGPVATVVSEEQRQWLESLPARSDGSEDG
ncbi:hypothetical protein V6N13_143624 [Hibiscus sabdariffa]